MFRTEAMGLVLVCGLAMIPGVCLAEQHGRVGFLCEAEPKGDYADLISWTASQGYNHHLMNPWPQGRFKAAGSDEWADLDDYAVLWLDVSAEIVRDEEPGPLPAVWLEKDRREALLDYLRGGGMLIVSTPGGKTAG